MPFQRFRLERKHDSSGISGTGVVAQGVEFDGGTVVLCWNQNSSLRATVGVYPDLRTMAAIHGHGGSTSIIWLEQKE